MTWFEQSANETEAAREHVHMFVAVDFDFPSGHARFWSGVGELVINGNTYLGSGELGGFSVPEEATNLVAERKTYRLSGVDPSLVAESDIDDSFGRTITEYFGFLNPETRALLAPPEINWEGRIDSFRRVDGDEPVIEVNAEHRMVLLDKTDGWRYTHDHQQQFFAGDKGFDQVGKLESKEVIWGGKRTIVGVKNMGGRYGVYTYAED